MTSYLLQTQNNGQRNIQRCMKHWTHSWLSLWFQWKEKHPKNINNLCMVTSIKSSSLSIALLETQSQASPWTDHSRFFIKSTSGGGKHRSNRTTYPLCITDVVKYLRQAWATLKDHQKRHLELRSNHLTELAEARVLARCPALDPPEKTATLEKNTAKEVRRIIYKEKKAAIIPKNRIPPISISL